MKKKIWLVDDDKTYMFICRRLFQLAGYKVSDLHLLSSSLVAMKQIRHLHNHAPAALPALILLDVNMPKLDGWRFIEQLQPYTHNMQIVMFSACLNPGDEARTRHHKAVIKYLVKPLTLSQIKTLSQVL